MTTPTDHTDTRRVPGWERVLDAFMADPDRIRTNVELGQIPGVQAFHQRLSDLIRYGYVLTPAVTLRQGRTAYALVGYEPNEHRWPHARPRPYLDRLPAIGDADDSDRLLEAAAKSIQAEAHTLLNRTAPPVEPIRSDAGRSRAMRDAAACLAVALGDDVVGDWPVEDRGDVLALARAARDELGRVRSLRALEDANAENAAQVRDATSTLRDALPEGILADLDLGGVRDYLPALAGAAREEIARLTADLAAAQAAPRRARQPRAERGPTGPELMRKALDYHEQPMHSAKIAEWVLANGGDKVYKGLTPAATMAAQLATSNVKGGEFVKVAPGCFGLREWATGGADGGPQLDEFGNELLELDPVKVSPS